MCICLGLPFCVFFLLSLDYLFLCQLIIIIIINQFLTRQMPVSQVLRRGGRYATSQFGLIIKSKCWTAGVASVALRLVSLVPCQEIG